MGDCPASAVVHWSQRDALERLCVRAIFQNLGEHIEPLQVNELLRDELIREFLLQHLRVRVADAKREQRADVAKNRMPDGKWNLINVLMR